MFDYIRMFDPRAKCIRLSHDGQPEGLDGLCTVRKQSIPGVYHEETCTAIFTSHQLPEPLPHRPLMVYLWHGMPVKRIGNDLPGNRPQRLSNHQGFALATSPYFRGIVARAFGADLNDVALTSLPRNDVLVRSRGRDVPKVPQQNASKALVMWLPTWRDDRVSSALWDWSDDEWLEIDLIVRQASVELVVKLHPNENVALREVMHNLSNVNVISHNKWTEDGLDLYAKLSQSSALITDISSVAVDFLITGRSVGIAERSIESHRSTIVPVTMLKNAFHLLRKPPDFDAIFAGRVVPEPSIAEMFYAPELRVGSAAGRIYAEVQRRTLRRNATESKARSRAHPDA